MVAVSEGCVMPPACALMMRVFSEQALIMAAVAIPCKMVIARLFELSNRPAGLPHLWLSWDGILCTMLGEMSWRYADPDKTPPRMFKRMAAQYSIDREVLFFRWAALILRRVLKTRAGLKKGAAAERWDDDAADRDARKAAAEARVAKRRGARGAEPAEGAQAWRRSSGEGAAPGGSFIVRTTAGGGSVKPFAPLPLSPGSSLAAAEGGHSPSVVGAGRTSAVPLRTFSERPPGAHLSPTFAGSTAAGVGGRSQGRAERRASEDLPSVLAARIATLAAKDESRGYFGAASATGAVAATQPSGPAGGDDAPALSADGTVGKAPRRYTPSSTSQMSPTLSLVRERSVDAAAATSRPAKPLRAGASDPLAIISADDVAIQVLPGAAVGGGSSGSEEAGGPAAGRSLRASADGGRRDRSVSLRGLSKKKAPSFRRGEISTLAVPLPAALAPSLGTASAVMLPSQRSLGATWNGGPKEPFLTQRGALAPIKTSLRAPSWTANGNGSPVKPGSGSAVGGRNASGRGGLAMGLGSSPPVSRHGVGALNGSSRYGSATLPGVIARVDDDEADCDQRKAVSHAKHNRHMLHVRRSPLRPPSAALRCCSHPPL